MKDIYEFDNTCGRVGFRKNGMRINKNQVLRDLNLMSNHMINEGCELEEITGIKVDIIEETINSKLFNNRRR